MKARGGSSPLDRTKFLASRFIWSPNVDFVGVNSARRVAALPLTAERTLPILEVHAVFASRAFLPLPSRNVNR